MGNTLGGRVLAMLAWALVIVLVIAARELVPVGWLGWVIALLLIAVTVGLVYLVRKHRSTAADIQHHWAVAILGGFVPQLDRVVAELALREQIREANRSKLERLDTMLAAYDLSPLPDEVHAQADAPRELSVEDCAHLAAGVPAIAGVIAPAPTDAEAVLALLFWDYYGDNNGRATKVWMDGRERLAPLIAHVAVRRQELKRLGADVSDVKQFLGDAPRYKTAAIVEHIRRLPTTLVGRMADTVKRYRLHGAQNEWTAPSGAASGLETLPEDKRTAHCAHQLAEHLKGVSPKLLELLYCEQYVPEATEQLKASGGEALNRKLAGALAGSGLLKSGVKAFWEDPALLGRVIRPMRAYRLSFVRGVLIALQRLLDAAAVFAAYLEEDQHLGPVELGAKRIVRFAERMPDGLPSSEVAVGRLRGTHVTIDLLAQIAEKAVGRLVPEPETETEELALEAHDERARLVADLAVVVLGRYVAQGPTGMTDAVAVVSRDAAHTQYDQAARILLGWLAMEEEDGQAVTFDRVVAGWQAACDGLGKDWPELLAEVKRLLGSGTWPAVTPRRADSAIDDLATRVNDLISKAPTAIPPAEQEALRAQIEHMANAVHALGKQVEAQAASRTSPASSVARALDGLRAATEALEAAVEPEFDQLHTEVGSIDKALDPQFTALRQKLDELTRYGSARRYGDADLDRYYLVTFDARKGPLATIIDSLYRITGPRRKRLLELDDERIQRLLERVDAGSYHFGDYTKYARVGILRDDQTFREFCQSYFTDLRLLMEDDVVKALVDPKPGTHIEWRNVEVTITSLGGPWREDFCEFAGGTAPVFRTRSVDEPELEERLGGLDKVMPLR